MKTKIQHMILVEVFILSNNNKQNKSQPRQSDNEKRTGYGDKKLEGPNRPAE
jgi:hypothetical protein